MSTIDLLRAAKHSKVPERQTRWWALEMPDGTLLYDLDEHSTFRVHLFYRKDDAEASLARFKEEYEPPIPRVVSIVICGTG